MASVSGEDQIKRRCVGLLNIPEGLQQRISSLHRAAAIEAVRNLFFRLCDAQS